MNDIFVDTSQEIEITIFTGILEGITVADIDQEEIINTYPGISNIEKHLIWIKLPEFGDYTIGNSVLQARFNKIISLVKRWTLKDEHDIIPVTEDRIRLFHPILVNVIGIEIERTLLERGLS